MGHGLLGRHSRGRGGSRFGGGLLVLVAAVRHLDRRRLLLLRRLLAPLERAGAADLLELLLLLGLVELDQLLAHPAVLAHRRVVLLQNLPLARRVLAQRRHVLLHRLRVGHLRVGRLSRRELLDRVHRLLYGSRGLVPPREQPRLDVLGRALEQRRELAAVLALLARLAVEGERATDLADLLAVGLRHPRRGCSLQQGGRLTPRHEAAPHRLDEHDRIAVQPVSDIPARVRPAPRALYLGGRPVPELLGLALLIATPGADDLCDGDVLVRLDGAQDGEADGARTATQHRCGCERRIRRDAVDL